MTSLPLASRTLESFRIRSGFVSDGQRNIGRTTLADWFTLLTAELPGCFWSSVHPESPLNVSLLYSAACSMYGMMWPRELVPSRQIHPPQFPLPGLVEMGKPSDAPAVGKKPITSW